MSDGWVTFELTNRDGSTRFEQAEVSAPCKGAYVKIDFRTFEKPDEQERIYLVVDAVFGWKTEWRFLPGDHLHVPHNPWPRTMCAVFLAEVTLDEVPEHLRKWLSGNEICR